MPTFIPEQNKRITFNQDIAHIKSGDQYVYEVINNQLKKYKSFLMIPRRVDVEWERISQMLNQKYECMKG